VLADFAVGFDVGLGVLGDSRSTLSAGVRYADFQSATRAITHGVNWDIPDAWVKYPSHRDEYKADITAHREFTGLGPTLSWEAAQKLIGSREAGHLDLEWSVTGGVLFGKQENALTGSYAILQSDPKYHSAPQGPVPLATPLDVAPRSKDVTVPLVDVSLGLSYEAGRFRAGVGYRWERYFDVLDVGYDEHKDADRTIDGPYVKFSLGFGG
jgi:hypothetical protein